MREIPRLADQYQFASEEFCPQNSGYCGLLSQPIVYTPIRRPEPA